MLLVKNLSFSYADKPLYKDVGFMIAKGKKVGLVGPNGVGKSIFIKILSLKWAIILRNLKPLIFLKN